MTDYKDPREEDIVYGDRRISRPDVQLPDWDIPDGSYRAVPIVWFTGALFAQIFLTGFLFLVLIGKSGWLTIALTAMSSGAIGAWTWQRGMGQAGMGWRVATILMLLLWFALFAFAAASRT